jgi:hypothetical protein
MSSVISLNNIALSLHILFILFNFLSIHFSNDFFFLMDDPMHPKFKMSLSRDCQK